MRRFFSFLFALLFGGLLPVSPQPQQPSLTYVRMSIREQADLPADGMLRAVWMSQFDLHPVYRDGGKQRDREEFRQIAQTICETLCADGFNTVFLQMRPNGDSLYESDLYPLSKYVAGTYGGKIEYDAVGVFLEVAKAHGLSVHAWINPLRLVTPEEMQQIPKGYAVRDWYDADNGYVKEWDGRLYVDPSYAQVRQLIADGAAEILERYDVDGIHMDDYFYPTTDEAFDPAEFKASGMESLGEFRRDNINQLVRLLYETVHAYGSDKQFGIAPAGNLDSLADGYFADAKYWCRETGYIDYIMPQLYFGFQNAYCPFDEMVTKWANAVTNEQIKLYIGLDAAKAYLGSQGELDAFAGTQEGKTEWIREKDILARSLRFLYREKRVSGYCFFSYSYLYDRFSGEVLNEISQEYEAFAPLLQSERT